MRRARFSAAVLVAVQAASHVAALPHPQADGTAAPTLTFSTAVASPTVPATQDLPSQAPLPPTQPWCKSEIFCAGELLQTVNLANLFTDPKTFVDKPTNGSSQSVLDAFNKIVSGANNNPQAITEQQMLDFVDTNFKGEGLELEAQALPSFNQNPPFLQNVSDPIVKAWSQTVHGYWTQLIRGTNSSTLCNGESCESTLIPLNHTFVVPGGRFREQYYWDSYWIVKGLLVSQLHDVVNATLQNFMDEIEQFGFIPNGGRIYYLDRSQPPLFINMLSDYVEATGDRSILDRALPLAEKELQFWKNNRTISVTSPYTNQTYEVSRYAVNNSAPRPESYLQDYTTANVGIDLTEEQKQELYAELATGAETGWDYTARFYKDPAIGQSTLNIRATIPICLNSILYKAHLLLADLYSSSNTKRNDIVWQHQQAAAQLRSAILDLFWNKDKLAFYDFNLTSNARNDFFSVAHFYPLWVGIFPDEILANETATFGAFSTINLVMNKYNGTYPTTFLVTGQQWDAPNAWPPHNYIALAALQNIPANLSTMPVPTTPSGQSSFALVPANQIGLSESELPSQPVAAGKNASVGVDVSTLKGTVINGGNATDGETWAHTLQRELANRYITSALCSWHATGGSLPGLLPQLGQQELNLTNSVGNTGNMFEKFSITDIDSSGTGGEYTVQAGFGWTNGVALWTAAMYGKELATPQCPDVLAEESITGADGGNSGSSTSSASPSGSSSGSSSGAMPALSDSVAKWVALVAGAASVLAAFL